MPDPAPVRPEELAAHDASVRALAAHLLGDAHLADDVAQDASIVALTRPPRPGVPLGPWLRGVARHLSFRTIRARARARSREATAARPEAQPADDVVERAELRHLVVAELLALQDPIRRTLLLHWFEGLEPARIAEREGVPPGTVRSRLSRGLELLRGRLDARFRGDRHAWAVPLAAAIRGLPLPGVPGPSEPTPDPAGGPVTPDRAPGRAPDHSPDLAPEHRPGAPSSHAVRSPPKGGLAHASVPVVAGGILMSMKWIAAATLVVLACIVGWSSRTGDGPGTAPPAPPATAAPGATPGEPVAAGPNPRTRPPDPAGDTDAPPAASAAPHADVWISGRVVADGRHPAAQVSIVVVLPNGEPLAGGTDGSGRFRIPVHLPAVDPETSKWAAVHARAADGRVAVRTVALDRSEPDADAGTLVLGPAAALVVEVRADGSAAAGVRVTAGRWSWPATVGVTDASGRTALGPLPEGEYVVEAYDPARGHAVAGVTVPGAADPVPLALTRRDVTVTVVRKGTSEPVPGVRAAAKTVRLVGDSHHVAAFPSCVSEPTAADGTTVLRGLAADARMSVELRLPGAPERREPYERPSLSLRPGATTLRFEVPRATTFRFRVQAGDVAPPPEGTVLRLVPFANSGLPAPAETGVMRDGAIVVESAGAERVLCLALAPDGTVAMLRARGDDGSGEATFRRERTLVVAVRDTSGRPIAGRWVVARDQGNNAVQAPAATGADGTVTFRGLWGQLVDVSLLDDPKFPWGGRAAGSANLEQGDARVEAVVPDEVRVRLRVTTDGRPGLPSDYTVVGGRVETEDPDAGTIDVVAVPVNPGAAVVLTVRPAGFVPERVEVAPGATGPVPVTLRRTGSVVLRIGLPADGKASASLQQWNEQASAWRAWSSGPGRAPGQGLAPDAGGRVRITDVPPGRYRLLDGLTWAASGPFLVEEGSETDAGLLDLSRAGPVNGRVLVPDGTSYADVKLVVEAPGLAPPPAGWDSQPTRIGADGSFRLRVPGDRPVRIRAVHPTMRAASSRPFVEVTTPADDVELALERGPIATLRGKETIHSGRFGGAPTVRLFEGEPSGTPVAEIAPEVADGAIRFGVPRTGRFTVWVDAAPWAPLMLRDVAFGEDDVDLGTHEFPAGSTVRLKLLVPAGQAPPRIGAWATAPTAPTYARGTNSNGEAEVLLRGLGPGTFDLMASPIMDFGLGGRSPLRRTITVDGAATTEVVVELDLR